MCYKIFQDSYNKACDLFIPIYKPSNNQKAKYKSKWMTNDLFKLVQLKKKLFHQNLASKWSNAELVTQYKATRKKVNSETHKKIRDYEESLAYDKKNPKRLFAYINSRKKVTSKISSMKYNDEITTDKQKIANSLNNQFESVFVNDDFIEPSFEKRTNEILSELVLTTSDVLDELTRLDPNKSIGPDLIHPWVLKYSADSLVVPLKLLFNNSINEGKVPLSWKNANITALFKKGSKVDPGNYRPISITSVVSKLLEKLIKNAIMKHLTHLNLLSKKQHGFVQNKSCATNLIESSDFITDALANKYSVDLILLDFSKAFDKVSHPKLLLKLENYGISGKILQWIRSFLQNRNQRVVMGDYSSEWCQVRSGVPQGSVIGPLLFIIYINDLPDLLNCNSSLFADDTKIYSRLSESSYELDVERIQLDLDIIVKWCNDWQMELNVDKCKVMHIGRLNKNHNYTMLNNDERKILLKTESERDLGIIISNNMKYESQCNKASSSAIRMLNLLKHTFNSRDINLWKKLYMTYIRPLLEYSVASWSPHLQKDIYMLEKVQRRATKTCYQIKQLDYETRCDALGLTTLEKRRKRGDLIQQFKFVNNINIVNWTVEPVYREPRVDRRPMLVREMVRNCRLRFDFFNNRIVGLWNNLPDHVVISNNVNSFKNNLDKFLSTNPL